MGQILSTPITDKQSEHGGNKYFSYGLSSMQGWRINMEDAHTTILDLKTVSDKHDSKKNNDSTNSNDKTNNDNSHGTKASNDLTNNEQHQQQSGEADDDDPVAFFAVFDGHGGDKIAIYSGDNLYKIVANDKDFKIGNYSTALKNSFLNADVEILKTDGLKNDQSGCTATTILINKNKIICANSGDSRTVLSVNGNAKPLSYDHKPTNPGEHQRICAAGGFVDFGRVNGNLALSRAIGDFDFKKRQDRPVEEQMVTALPDIIEHEITPDDEFVILACDGIWDCLSSQQAVEVVRRGIVDGKNLTEISEGMIDICLAPTAYGSGIGCDNMSIIIVAILNGKTEEQWYKSIIEKGGPVSASFEEVTNDIYGAGGVDAQQQEKAAQQEEEELNTPQDGAGGATTAVEEEAKSSFSIQQLLEQNVLMNQNGVFYLDSANLLSQLGVEPQGAGGNSNTNTNTDAASGGTGVVLVDEISEQIQRIEEEIDEDQVEEEDDEDGKIEGSITEIEEQDHPVKKST